MISMKRIVLKLSGEAFGQDALDAPFAAPAFDSAAREIALAQKSGTGVIVVVGGGNIARGATLSLMGIARVEADQVGMLATIQNAILLQARLEALGVSTRVLSAIRVDAVCEPYLRRRALRHLEKGRVVICAAGTGNPFATTDSAATLRALELEADALLFAKNGVDGVYTADPKVDPSATRIERLTYRDVLAQDLHFMDQGAIAQLIASERDLPIYVYDAGVSGNLLKLVRGEMVGTIVTR